MKNENIKQLKLQNKLVEIVYKKIFELDTKTLTSHYWSVYHELISRDDFNDIDDLRVSYELIKEELIKRGVTNV